MHCILCALLYSHGELSSIESWRPQSLCHPGNALFAWILKFSTKFIVCSYKKNVDRAFLAAYCWVLETDFRSDSVIKISAEFHKRCAQNTLGSTALYLLSLQLCQKSPAIPLLWNRFPAHNHNSVSKEMVRVALNMASWPNIQLCKKGQQGMR